MIFLQKRSHKLLASTLLRSHRGFAARRYEWAFLFGSFQPDCNPFTFLRGSCSGRPFGGHNYSNSRRYIRHRIRKLQRCSDWRIRHYYTLGKLTHYLADAFTYPHNESFPDTQRVHHRYETALRHALARQLAASPPSPLSPVCCRDLPVAIDLLHRHYVRTASDVVCDVRWILAATGLLMACCRPVPENTP